MKLGQLLVNKGIISRAQLDETLASQLIYGGHLGTCLIEKGFVEENDLGEVLSEITSMPYAPPKAFQRVPRYVIASLPARIVAKHHVVPFRLEDGVLDVAMIDPRNLAIVDELSFAAGLTVKPWIAPEARIYQALERYWDIPRRQRFVALCRMLDGDAAELARVVESNAHEPELLSPVAIDSLLRVDESGSLETVAEVLARAESLDELAEAVLGFATLGMRRAVLLRVRGAEARIWRTAGIGLSPDHQAEVRFPVVTDPLFQLMRGEPWYRGAVEPERFAAFGSALKLDAPREMMLVPLYLDDRLIGLFYGDGGIDGPIAADTDDVTRVMRKLALAMHVLRLRRQILAA